jgi:cytochrome c6
VKAIMKRHIAAAFAVAACASCWSLWAKAQDDGSTPATVYKSKCAVCHAADGSGGGTVGKQLNVPSFRSREVQGQTNEQLGLVISDGRGKMPGYRGKISDDQVKQLVTYVRELAPHR